MRPFFAVKRFMPTSIVALHIALLLAGCTVGPEYIKTPAPTTSAYKEAAPALFKESERWQPAHPGDQVSRGYWLEICGDPKLSKFEMQIADSNQKLKVAEARFREARAAIRFNRAAQFPTISASSSASYVKSSGHSPNSPSKIQQVRTGAFGSVGRSPRDPTPDRQGRPEARTRC